MLFSYIPPDWWAGALGKDSEAGLTDAASELDGKTLVTAWPLFLTTDIFAP